MTRISSSKQTMFITMTTSTPSAHMDTFSRQGVIEVETCTVKNNFTQKLTTRHQCKSFKVTNSEDSKDVEFFDAQHCMILHLAEAGLVVPEPVKNRNVRF